MGRCLPVPFLIGRVTDGYQNGGSCYLSSCGGIQTDYSQFEIAFTSNKRLTFDSRGGGMENTERIGNYKIILLCSTILSETYYSNMYLINRKFLVEGLHRMDNKKNGMIQGPLRFL